MKTIYKVYDVKYDTNFYFVRVSNTINHYSKYIKQYFNEDFNNEVNKVKEFLKNNLSLFSSKEKIDIFNSTSLEYKVDKKSLDFHIFDCIKLCVYNQKKIIKNLKVNFSKLWNLKKVFKNIKSESLFVEKIEKILFDFLYSKDLEKLKKYTLDINEEYKFNLEFL